jgi:triosephosphate isomerase
MNGAVPQIVAYIDLLSHHLFLDTVVLALPFVYLDQARQMLSPCLHLGGQDLSQNAKGAYTGSISGAMLKEMGCEYVIIGHSERRRDFLENNAMIMEKISRAFENQLIPVICIGESLNQDPIDVLTHQLDEIAPILKEGKFIIAYEPVWSIGTGKIPTKEEISKVASFIHQWLLSHNFLETPILYGGSVTPENAPSLKECDHISGFLIGGASMNAQSLINIIQG